MTLRESPDPTTGRAADTAVDLARAGHEAERTGNADEARVLFERALHRMRPVDTADLATSLLRWIAWAWVNAGDPDAALDCLEAAEASAEASGDERALASVLNTRAGTLFNLGELDQAETLFWRVRSLAWRLRDRKRQAMADQNLGNVASIRGDLSLALRRFEASLTAYEELGEVEYVGPLLNNIGRLQIELGNHLGAERTLRRARRCCLDRGDGHHRILVEANRARLRLATGRPAPALRAAAEALRLVQETGDDRWVAEIHLITGAAHAAMASHREALRSLERAGGIARRRQDAKVLADVMLEQGRVFRALGENRDTLRSLNEAHRIFRHLRARRDLADVGTRLDELEQTFLRIVLEWGESIESKDAYTQGHCSRVADYACALATASGLPEEDLTWFRMGALLHDVGKVAVPLEILTKRGPLTDGEFRVMATHPVAGVELLDGIEFPWDIRPMIRHHHERWNGTGYPDGLAGEGIPLEARVLTVADIYDALTTTRSYRPAHSRAEARAIMEAEAGRTLDPALLTLFLERVAPAPSPTGGPIRAGWTSRPFAAAGGPAFRRRPGPPRRSPRREPAPDPAAGRGDPRIPPRAAPARP